MGFFSCPINHDLIDTGIEQELAFMFVPARKIWESATGSNIGRIGQFRLADLKIGGLSVIPPPSPIDYNSSAPVHILVSFQKRKLDLINTCGSFRLNFVSKKPNDRFVIRDFALHCEGGCD